MSGRRKDPFAAARVGLERALEGASKTWEGSGGAERGGPSPAKDGSLGLRVVEGGAAAGVGGSRGTAARRFGGR